MSSALRSSHARRLELFDEAETLLSEAPVDKIEKADLLTSMALLSGIISRDLPMKLIQRRRNLMIESYGYELIKREGYEEGLQEGIEKGMLESVREMLLDVLSERFNIVPEEVERRIKNISSKRILKDLHRYALRVSSLEDFVKVLS